VTSRKILGLSINVSGIVLDHFPVRVADEIAWWSQRIMFGNLERYGLARSPNGIATTLVERQQTPAYDDGFVRLLKAGEIKIVPAVVCFDDSDVLLADGTRIQPDAVIAATGYRRGLEPLVGHLGVLGTHANCAATYRRRSGARSSTQCGGSTPLVVRPAIRSPALARRSRNRVPHGRDPDCCWRRAGGGLDGWLGACALTRIQPSGRVLLCATDASVSDRVQLAPASDESRQHRSRSGRRLLRHGEAEVRRADGETPGARPEQASRWSRLACSLLAERSSVARRLHSLTISPLRHRTWVAALAALARGRQTSLDDPGAARAPDDQEREA
jgi:hypothetical protein